MLYIVATPIGNLQDITLRALEVLKNVSLVACEDTRRTRILFEHYGIRTATTSYYQHNRFTKGDYLTGLLKEGKDIALVSDAGMPGILDPGYHLVNLAIAHGIPLTVIPGPTALVNALVLSGKPAHSFIFAGFLSPKSGARLKRLQELSRREETVVFYESCHRILLTLRDMDVVFKDKEVVCIRELTKKFEEIKRGPARELLAHFQSSRPRGEFVVVI